MPTPESLLPPTIRAHEFPLTAEQTYLNAATQGPIPALTRHAIEHAAARDQFPGSERDTAAQHSAELARSRLAQLLHVGADDLVFTPNTTYGLNICAQGIAWREGDNVVLPDHEFPSVMHTWLNLRNSGVEVRLVPWEGEGPSVDALMAAVDARTRVVSCSAVAWDSGYRIDLEALGRRCAQAGCLLIVDGIQAVGATELDPQRLGISALAMHGYKWLVAGFGCGALYVAPSAIDQIRPRFAAEQSFIGGGEPGAAEAAWQPGARRYTVGGSNNLGLTALASSLGLIAELGMPNIAAYNRQLAQLLVDGLAKHAPALQLISPTDPARRAAIVVFTLGDRQRDEALVQRLAKQGIIVALRRRGVRVSPHFYNSPEEIERLLRALAQ
jgi:cysteine desulfurase/selenocysteine lyase